ncbi:MAG: Zn-ribbon domain-containing OB-fold protein [candidate division Zixibacteria bacterium]
MSGPRYWREMPQRYRLEAVKCKKCGKVLFPPRLICPACKSREFENTQIGDKGKVEAFTIIRVAPSQFTDLSPYPVAIVNVGDDVKILCQIADCEPEDLRIGMQVEIEFRKIQQEGHGGILNYGYKCVPA